jgi:hypothetical protein
MQTMTDSIYFGNWKMFICFQKFNFVMSPFFIVSWENKETNSCANPGRELNLNHGEGFQLLLFWVMMFSYHQF